MSNPEPNVDVPEVFTPPAPEICVRMARQQIALALEHMEGIPAQWNTHNVQAVTESLSRAATSADHILALYPDGTPPADLDPEDEGTLPPWQA